MVCPEQRFFLSVCPNFHVLLAKMLSSSDVHDDMILHLIRAGVDQCKHALVKLSNPKLSRKHQETLTKAGRANFRRQHELRELRLDDVSNKVEGIMSKARKLMSELEQDPSGFDDHASSDDCNEGWIEPYASPTQHSVDTVSDCDMGDFGSRELPSFNPHRFAMTKRKEIPKSRRTVPVSRNKRLIASEAVRGAPEDDDSEGQHDLDLRPKRRRRPQSLVHVDGSPEAPVIDTNHIFDRIERRSDSGNRRAAQIGCTSADGLSELIVQAFPEEALQNKIEPLLRFLVNPNSFTDDKNELCEVLSQCLRSSGSLTLTAFLSYETRHCRAYILILIASLQISQKLANDELVTRDTANIFCFEARESLITLIAHQLVDAVYALLHPTAWVSDVVHPDLVLNELEVLRDELADHADLVELVCRIVTERLGPQKWLCDFQQGRAYCSSFDPDEWQTFLIRGELSSVPREIRLSLFQGGLPREEIEVLWSVLGFAAGHRVHNRSLGEGQARWKLVNILFARGSLASPSDNCEHLPPCPEQLDAVISDLLRFGDLLLSGTFDNLPGQDTLVVKIVERSIRLGADAVASVDDNQVNDETLRGNEHEERRVMKELLDVAQGKRFVELSSRISGSTLMSTLLDRGCGGDEFILRRCLPSSMMIRSALWLLCAWYTRINGKRVRQQRFMSATKSLATKCLQEATDSSSSSGVSDVFSSVFSGASGSLSQTRSGFFQEFATFLNIVMSSISGGTTNAEHPSGCLRAAKAVWQTLSGEGIQSTSNSNLAESGPRTGEPLKTHVAAKAMLYIGLEHLRALPRNMDANPLGDGYVIGSGDDVISYILSQLVVCLDISVEDPTCKVSTSIMLMLLSYLSLVNRRILQGPIAQVPSECVNPLNRRFWYATSKLLTKIASSRVFEQSTSLCFAASCSLIQAWTKCSIFEADSDMTRPGSDRKDVCSLLVHILSKSIPSVRFEVSVDDAGGEALPNVVTAVRVAAANEIPALCECLASLCIASDGVHLHPLCNFISTGFYRAFNSSSYSSQSDVDFVKRVAFTFTAAMMDLWKPQSLAPVVSPPTFGSYIQILLDQALDSGSAQRIPSGNLDRIRAHSGEDGRTKEIRRFQKFNGSTAELEWKFVQNLAAVLLLDSVNEDYRTLGAALQESARCYELEANDRESKFSLEWEIFQRMCLSFRVMKAAIPCSGEHWNIAELVPFVISRSSNQLLRQAFAHFEYDADVESYSFAKSFELMACFLEFHIGIVSFLCREASDETTVTWRNDDVWTQYFDGFLCLLLRGDSDAQALDVLAELSKFQSAATVPITRKVTLCDMLRHSIIRRSREFVVCIARSRVTNSIGRKMEVFYSLIQLATSGRHRHAMHVARSFNAKAVNTVSICDESRSPLERRVDKYFEEDGSRAFNPADALALRNLRHDALSYRLIRTLQSGRTNGRQRSAILQFVSMVLQHDDSDEDTSRLEDLATNIGLVCHLMRAMEVSLRYALIGGCLAPDPTRQDGPIDFHLVAKVFECAKTLLSMSGYLVDRDGGGSLIDWARRNGRNLPRNANPGTSKATPGGVLNGMDPADVSAAYAWSFLHWLGVFGQLVHPPSSVSNVEDSEIVEYQRRLRSWNTTSRESSPETWPPMDHHGLTSAAQKENLSQANVPVQTSFNENDVEARVCLQRFQELTVQLFSSVRHDARGTVDGPVVVNQYKRNRTAAATSHAAMAVQDTIDGNGDKPDNLQDVQAAWHQASYAVRQFQQDLCTATSMAAGGDRSRELATN
jgi:hypothetical protein